jgi:NADH dehydrogenase
MVTKIDADGVCLGDERISAATVLWGAGVRTQRLTGTLGLPLDRIDRVIVENDCSLKGHPDAFAIGDMAHFKGEDGKPLPGVSPVAMQQARSVAKNIQRSIRGEERVPFRYLDKGSMATIGRSRAIAEVGRVKLSGFIAWMTWLLIHIWYLIGFRNRFIVMFEWMWSYITFRRGARLITNYRVDADREAASRRASMKPPAKLAPAPDATESSNVG